MLKWIVGITHHAYLIQLMDWNNYGTWDSIQDAVGRIYSYDAAYGAYEFSADGTDELTQCIVHMNLIHTYCEQQLSISHQYLDGMYVVLIV
jgi:hypothetical protein